jgi:hypothetical protein
VINITLLQAERLFRLACAPALSTSYWTEQREARYISVTFRNCYSLDWNWTSKPSRSYDYFVDTHKVHGYTTIEQFIALITPTGRGEN